MANNRHNGGPVIDDEGSPYGSSGWIKVARDIRSHPLVGFGKIVKPCEPERGFCYSRNEAWTDLLMECRYSPGEVMNKGRKMEIKPGQLVGAVSWLAHRWNWTPKTVRWFLDQLQEDGMIKRETELAISQRTEIDRRSDDVLDRPNSGNRSGKQNGNQSQVLTICNYDIYQLAMYAQRQAKGQTEGQPDGKQAATERQANGNTLRKEEGKKEEEVRSSSPQQTEATPRHAHVAQPAIAAVRKMGLPSDPLKGFGLTYDQLQDRLVEAANGSLANLASAPGLLNLSEPIMWLEDGCDLERDIVPALRALSAKKKSIGSWNYFRKAVGENRDRRIAGMPQTHIPQTTAQSLNSAFAALAAKGGRS